jgi:YidC/Oxa1 family membrane protein insertase
MERNQIIGIVLIMATFMLWVITSSPSKEELEKAKMRKDSIALAESLLKDSLTTSPSAANQDTLSPANDSLATLAKSVRFGAFASAAKGTNNEEILENDLVRITFSSKGGTIREVLLKKHYKTVRDTNGKDTKELVKMLNSPNNRFEYRLPVKGSATGTVSTSELFFTASKQGNTVTFRAPTTNGGYFEQKYTLAPDNYIVDYSIAAKDLGDILGQGQKSLDFYWENHLNKYEIASNYEQNQSTVYFKEKDERRDYCSCTSDDTKEVTEKGIQWVAHANQFFSSALMAGDQSFEQGKMTTRLVDLTKSEDVKVVTSEFKVPLSNLNSGSHDMKIYIGPNEFKRLRALGNDLEEVIPFGSSIFGTINRWFIRPFFDFLSQYISSKGIVIILLIFLIKMLLYPLMYKMLYSQAKMGALKPELAQLKEKYKDDLQKQQMETMKIYREYGVSPFGGCMPMLLQMPIWYALFRFFPASITFRQEPFLWASDLSSYDVIFHHGVNIPYMGTHISLFTLLWAISTIIYTYYNMQNMDLSANPAMKYVQYIMPIMFLGFFNSYASGLTCYMFFSNLINILQTVITKKYLFDESKIRQQLLKEKDKPKKKSAFTARLEEAMKQQQALQEQKTKKKK